MRAAAAAAGGHAGAQLAVMGEAAVGARVSVWWPMDGQWFAGQVGRGRARDLAAPQARCIVSGAAPLQQRGGRRAGGVGYQDG
jgi:hypothetical protein